MDPNQANYTVILSLAIISGVTGYILNNIPPTDDKTKTKN